VKFHTEIRSRENALANFRIHASSSRFPQFRRERFNCRDPKKRFPGKGKAMAIPASVLKGNPAKKIQ
jgi:hypothetical protein